MTSCTIGFYAGGKKGVRPTKDALPISRFYVHCDGYPGGRSGIVAVLGSFFEAVIAGLENASCKSTRFYDPCYLGARFCAWKMAQNAKYNGIDGQPPPPPWVSMSFGVIPADADYGADYEYAVVCDGADAQPPSVFWRRCGEKTWRKPSPTDPD